MTPHTTPDQDASETTSARFEVEDILSTIRNRARQQDAPDAEQPSCPIAPRELPAGTRLGGYTLSRVLGSGGFAVTYLAVENGSGERMVIKEHFPEYLCYREAETLDVRLQDEAMASTCDSSHTAFLREYVLLASLRHPQIPRATACFTAHNTACYATEYIDGISLDALMEDYARHGRELTQAEVYGTLVRLLDALAYLHSNQLLHLDIKPSNILITREGLPKLIDFGSAHELQRGTPSCVVETPGFSPAEQGKPQGKLGPWTDLYALGATFHYLLSGNTLPPGVQRELVDHATPLQEQPQLRDRYHPYLLASIDRATSPHPKDRYQKVEEWFAALRV